MYYNTNRLKVGDSIKINSFIANKYGLNNTKYLLITCHQEFEAFPCGIINASGSVFFFSENETI